MNANILSLADHNQLKDRSAAMVKDQSLQEPIGLITSKSNTLIVDKDEGIWEEISSEIIEIDFTKIHDLG